MIKTTAKSQSRWGKSGESSALLQQLLAHASCSVTEDAHDTNQPFPLSLQAGGVWHASRSQDSPWSLLYSPDSCLQSSTAGFSLDPETVRAGRIAQSGNTEQNPSMKPPPYTGMLRAGSCSNSLPCTCFHGYALQVPTLNQSLLYTLLRIHILFIWTLCAESRLSRVCQATLLCSSLSKSCKQLLNADSRAGKKTFAHTLEILLFHWLSAGFCPGWTDPSWRKTLSL